MTYDCFVGGFTFLSVFLFGLGVGFLIWSK
jgi:hypothetical protein